MTTRVVRLTDQHRRQIVEHCEAWQPNEGCGLIAMDGDTVTAVFPTDNELASPTGFTIPPQQHLDALLDAEASGWRLGGVFHSHPNGPPVPSEIDIYAALDPEWIYLVVGLAGGVQIRAWSIANGKVAEISLN